MTLTLTTKGKTKKYARFNYCSICAIWCSKDRRYCASCGLLVRTKPRNSKFKSVPFEY